MNLPFQGHLFLCCLEQDLLLRVSYLLVTRETSSVLTGGKNNHWSSLLIITNNHWSSLAGRWVWCWVSWSVEECQEVISTLPSPWLWLALASFPGARFLITWLVSILEHSSPLSPCSWSTGTLWSGMNMTEEDTEPLQTLPLSSPPSQLLTWH